MVRQSVQYANLLEFSFLKICLDQLKESGSTRLYEKDRQSTEICKQRRKYLKRRKWNQIAPSLMLIKAHPINPENSM